MSGGRLLPVLSHLEGKTKEEETTKCSMEDTATVERCYIKKK